MKVLQFTIPVPHDKSVIAEKVSLPYHYPYLHRHKEIQLTWIQQGEGTLIAGNNMHDYSAGDLFLIGANLPHVFKSNPEYFAPNANKQIEALTIFFNPEGALAPLFNLPELKPSLIFMQQHQQGFKLPHSVVDKVSQIMIALQKASGPDQLIQFFHLLKGLTNIKTKLDPLSTYGNLPGITENEGIRIGNIYNYIMQHYSEPITLEDVAKVAYMTPESFCRYFKKHTGHTFISFLNEIRINEACKKLIAHKFESINTVAYKCGFKSITNFNRVFKCVIGNSPRGYLDSYNNNLISLNRAAS
ncbi:AraC family transcriptional regulator [Mucilaginibacter rubeus]|uniref:AraC family transcriptional regulator n=1 Tax=Mucilaginibacter rubeus TaxID=2027860 RepID=A0AAE6JGR7_9SPHI|nr:MULTISPECIES: AraC family transcriptional regulator [Mucilaginibacter]QEM05233.1 AraC family transcriptional regulator [Mucilaginibacter rubeus]QEM17825.1 AraC family transcriptional regulator [Mucilaginibacter gossypii]QTE45645.1 helix-turn-helix domain-containing protein [Mucilaginibacter rubeus]QTE52242.1 helix-turn-helix domain-containing protein [Mucilaginibacter rubeus]QTE57330.1 helix-turn-helix domain-containing protein [Mucilaginibacter rubeus]